MASMIGVQTLARRYARALAEVSPRDRTKISETLEDWRRTCAESPGLAGLLTDPRLAKTKRVDLARAIFEKMDCPPALMNFVVLLIEDGRMNLMGVIDELFTEEREKREGIQTVIIETAAALPEQMRERIRSRLAETLRLHVRIVEKVRPELLGGMNLRVGSRVWYGSAFHRLRQLFY
jgi:F-type H+-transporting ATPase subunit delta